MPESYDEEFSAFAAASLRDLRRTAYLICGDWHRAEDHAQDALIRVYRRWRRIERHEALLSYARRTAVRLVLDDLRRPARRREQPGLDRVEHSASVAPDSSSAFADRDRVRAALVQLPPRQRACVVLRFHLDLSVVETARMLGCTAGTVKSQSSDALRRLRVLLGDDLVTSPGRDT